MIWLPALPGPAPGDCCTPSSTEAPMHDLQLSINGMNCRHCVRDVTARLRDVHGVRRVVADARTSRVGLSGTMTTRDVRDALADTSYTVQVLSEPPPARP